MIGVRTAIGARPHRLTLHRAGTPIPDGDGGFTLDRWTPLDPPAVWGKVAPATHADLERLAAGTVITTRTRIATMPYHPQLSNLARVTWADRHGVTHVANVTGYQVTEDDTETIVVCEELAV